MEKYVEKMKKKGFVKDDIIQQASIQPAAEMLQEFVRKGQVYFSGLPLGWSMVRNRWGWWIYVDERGRIRSASQRRSALHFGRITDYFQYIEDPFNDKIQNFGDKKIPTIMYQVPMKDSI